MNTNTKLDYATLLRRDIQSLPDYVPVPPPDPARVNKLDSNENPFGPSPLVAEALAAGRWAYYPDAEPLRTDLAAYAGAPREQILVSNGSDEMLDLIVRAMIVPGETVVDCPPCFEMYSFYTRRAHGKVVSVERRADWTVDVEGVRRAQAESQAKIIFLASPNNPTGDLLPPDDLERLLGLEALVVVDEAYAEFAGESVVPRLSRHENLAVVRTFSKWAGLAGLRVGYGVLPLWLAAAVRRVKSPFNANSAGLAAARATLADLPDVQANVAILRAERDRMFVAFSRIPYLEPVPSRANFILCRVVGREARAVRMALAEGGYMVRGHEAPRLRDYLRITIGRPEQNDGLLEALHATGRA